MSQLDERVSTTSYRYQYSIACCARWEQEDVLEWVSYHKSIGFDHIYFFSNDDDPMPTFKVLTPFLFGDAPFITFKHFPKPKANLAQQPDIYDYFMSHYLNETEWFTFIDVDEFFVLKRSNNIKSFMKKYEDNCDALYFNWVLYGHSGKAERDNESLLLSHTQRAAGVDVHTKIITRSSKIDPSFVKSVYQKEKRSFWHFWSGYNIEGLRQSNVLFDRMDDYGIDFPNNALTYVRQPQKVEAIVDEAYVAHFQFRSEADVKRRVARGGSNTNVVWQKKVEDGSYLKLFQGRNKVWDVYLASFWLDHVGDAYDINLNTDTLLKNIALRRPNIQSSWHEPNPEDPPYSHAQGHANNGIRTGSYGFRTQFEVRPWWVVDLLQLMAILEIRIYNDVTSRKASEKADRLLIDFSLDQSVWSTEYEMTQEDFEKWVDVSPLVVNTVKNKVARYIRISSARATELQLDEVEVYGSPVGAATVAG